MTLPRLVVASRNPGKLREFGALLAGLAIEVESLASHPEAPWVPENGPTYLDNALAKAVAVAGACGLPAIADDSGLEVDALGGRPGVQSARYTGAGDAANVRQLLEDLAAVPAAQRTARFRCAVVVAHPDGRTLSAEGTCEGTIVDHPRGAAGFGYDPVFLDPSTGSTFAELSDDQKNRISHRARACDKLRDRLPAFLGLPRSTQRPNEPTRS